MDFLAFYFIWRLERTQVHWGQQNRLSRSQVARTLSKLLVKSFCGATFTENELLIHVKIFLDIIFWGRRNFHRFYIKKIRTQGRKAFSVVVTLAVEEHYRIKNHFLQSLHWMENVTPDQTMKTEIAGNEVSKFTFSMKNEQWETATHKHVLKKHEYNSHHLPKPLCI